MKLKHLPCQNHPQNRLLMGGSVRVLSVILSIGLLVGASQALAEGYEKGVMWGAHSGGEAGIATTWIQGADALNFNPAGLATDKPGKSVGLSLSPTWVQFSGPINFNNDNVTSSQALVMPAALNYSQSIGESIGVGIGYYTSAGSKAIYNGVDMLGGRTANVKTDLTVNELALGAGYKLNDQWKFGASVRYVMAQASFAFVVPLAADGSFYSDLGLDGTSGSALAFKVGTQFSPTSRTHYSLVFRSEATLNLAGSYSGFVQGAYNQSSLIGNSAVAHTALPMAITLGAQQDYEKWRALFEYVYTQYSRVSEIAVSGATTTAGSVTGIGVAPVNGVHALLNWHDEHQVRLGGEYIGYSWPIRFGYVFTSAVVDPTYARANLTPPGVAHTLTLGTGQDFAIASNHLTFDSALEYTMSSGTNTGLNAGQALDSNGGFTRSGTETASAYGIHLGVGYTF